MGEAVTVDLRLGDCLEILPTLAAGSVDAVVTDPPYGTTQIDFDAARLDWSSIWNWVYEVSKLAAIMALFTSQPFTTDLINSNRKDYRYEVVWEKSAFTGFLDANRKPLKAHETIQIFCRKPGASIYNPQFGVGTIRKNGGKGKRAEQYGDFKTSYTDNGGKRYPGSVLYFSNGHGDQTSFHPTEKPLAIMKWLVMTYTNPGDTILDPFMGSGTTGVACIQTDRNFIGIEIDEDYFNIAKKRIEQAQLQMVMEI